jgi:hypothetical protein
MHDSSDATEKAQVPLCLLSSSWWVVRMTLKLIDVLSLMVLPVLLCRNLGSGGVFQDWELARIFA